jgi:hypothetical protein
MAAQSCVERFLVPVLADGHLSGRSAHGDVEQSHSAFRRLG